ncbi:MAG: MerR family transcriptional regulator [Spirochaetes bacterium]|nr:MerR family transcriptional regulator [Spirochaetota bacterium]
MKYYSIGEVSEILKIKTHVLRYWEREVPFLGPQKSKSGRRIYTNRDVQLLFRFKYLTQIKKYTVQGARQKIWDDMRGTKSSAAVKIMELRTELVDILSKLRNRRSKNMERELKDSMLSIGQGHLFDYWDKRDKLKRDKLIGDLEKLDVSLLGVLTQRLGKKESNTLTFKPVGYVSIEESRKDKEALNLGKEFISSGKTAFLTVAGGQGSRLGFNGPKGTFKISPVRRVSLFQIFAEKLFSANRIYSTDIPWLIMTSRANYDETVDYFKKMNYFGLDSKSIHFFKQGMLPSLYPDGRLVLSEDGGIFQNPNGHGGVIKALHDSGIMLFLTKNGIEEIFYFQVDNPLVQVPDPLFLGIHLKRESEMSSKVIKKAFPEEKLGTIGLINGKPGVIEYSDLDKDTMYSRGTDGNLLFNQGSIAVHILNVGFLNGIKKNLPFHFARKKVKTLKPTEEGADLREEEVIKFEMFIFDAVPEAKNPVFFETERREEFAPLKNKTGIDSITTCLAGQIEKYSGWLEAAGVEVPRDNDNKPVYPVEISPVFALDREILITRKGELPAKIKKETLFA